MITRMTGSTNGNVRLRAARAARGLASQADFVAAVIASARAIGLGELSLSTRTVRRWESAAPPRPHTHHARALEELFNCSVNELGFPARIGGSPAPPAPHQAPPPATESLLVRPLRDTLDDTVLDDYSALTATYSRLYATLPSSALAASAAECATLGARLLTAATDAQRRRLASVVCDSWLLSARIQLFDIAAPAAARASLQQALHAARLAGDPARGSAVLAHLALSSATEDPPAEAPARDHIRMARTFAARAEDPPMLGAWIDAAEADIELRLGDPARAATLIGNAEALHKLHSTATAPGSIDWLNWLPAHRLAAIKADILLALGRTRDATTVLQHSALEAPTARQRAIAYTDLAAVAASEGEVDTACTRLNDALDALDGRWYDAVGNRINHARAQLDPWNTDPAVTALDQRLYTWTPALEAADR